MSLVILPSLTEAVQHLQAGDVVIYPTETSYALGADALNKKAIAQIYALKGRSGQKPLSIIVSSVNMAEKYLQFNVIASRLAKKYWPGALTLLLPVKKKIFARQLGSKTRGVAVRVSANKIARTLSSELGRPIIATSANQSGQGDSYTLRDLAAAFGASSETVYVVSSGTLPHRRPSTIARVTDHVEILRQGALRLKN